MKTISNQFICFIVLLFCLCLGTCGTKDNDTGKNAGRENDKKSHTLSKGKTMDLHELENKILSKDWDAVVLVDAADNKNDALPLLKDLYTNKDDDIRNIALNCLIELDTNEIPGLLAKGLSDSNEEVSGTALQALQSRYDKSILPQLIENLQNPINDIREGVALLVGSINDKSALTTLGKSYEEESNPEVKRSMMLALAKLGDNEKREEIVSQFDKEDSNVRLQAIKDLKYINDPTLSIRILPALNDIGKAYKINPINNIYSRVCDAAVTLIAFLHNNPFSFETGGKKIYTKEEIEEGKQFLQSLDKEH